MSSGSRFGREYLELVSAYEKLGGGVRSRDAVVDVDAVAGTSVLTAAAAAAASPPLRADEPSPETVVKTFYLKRFFC
jgi:hypothetical protein